MSGKSFFAFRLFSGLNEWMKSIGSSSDSSEDPEDSELGGDNSNSDIESSDEDESNKFLFKWIPSTRHSYTTPEFRVGRFPW